MLDDVAEDDDLESVFTCQHAVCLVDRDRAEIDLREALACCGDDIRRRVDPDCLSGRAGDAPVERMRKRLEPRRGSEARHADGAAIEDTFAGDELFDELPSIHIAANTHLDELPSPRI